MNLINTIYRIHTIGKQTHTYNKMSDILNILNQFNNTPKKPKEDKIESVESTESVIKKIVPPITSLDTFVARELQEILKPKISIIMQAYLGEYNGSRSNSIEKFIRAVESFNQQIYKNCEYLIYPSYFEAYGLPLIEAVNYKLKILASDVDYCWDLINPNDYFNPHDVSSIERCILRAINMSPQKNIILTPKDFINKIL